MTAEELRDHLEPYVYQLVKPKAALDNIMERVEEFGDTRELEGRIDEVSRIRKVKAYSGVIERYFYNRYNELHATLRTELSKREKQS